MCYDSVSNVSYRVRVDGSVTDILEHVRYLRQVDLSAEEIVMISLEFLVREVVPSAEIVGRYDDCGGENRLHLNVSWVSQTVSSLKVKSCRSASTEKCRSASSFSSTTAEESACLDA